MIFPNKSKPHVVREAAVTTTSYVAGTVVGLDEAFLLGIQITIVKGTETSFEFMIETSIDGGATYGQQISQSTTGGTTTITPNIYTIAAASCAATQVITFNINPIKGDFVKISTKSTGGNQAGTVAISCITGTV